MTTTLQYRKLHSDVVIPYIATDEAACGDVSAYLKPGAPVTIYNADNEKSVSSVPEDGTLSIHPGDRILIPTGWAVKVPKGFYMRIYSRSGQALKNGLYVANGVGVVDSDYRNEVFVLLGNSSFRWVKIAHGERIAQIDFAKINSFDTVTQNEYTDEEWFDSKRTGGFGSTGTR